LSNCSSVIPQELDADADSHLQPRFRSGERLYAPHSDR
jgi:hypothetical protein